MLNIIIFSTIENNFEKISLFSFLFWICISDKKVNHNCIGQMMSEKQRNKIIKNWFLNSISIPHSCIIYQKFMLLEYIGSIASQFSLNCVITFEKVLPIVSGPRISLGPFINDITLESAFSDPYPYERGVTFFIQKKTFLEVGRHLWMVPYLVQNLLIFL